jgi:hypothetical protein
MQLVRTQSAPKMTTPAGTALTRTATAAGRHAMSTIGSARVARATSAYNRTSAPSPNPGAPVTARGHA